MFEGLHQFFNGLKRYHLHDFQSKILTANGVYILFEKGEKVNVLDRITRVGSHPSNGRFIKRLQDHFNNNHRKSIMRKHIGKCFLIIENDPYINVWDYTNKDIKKGNPKLEEVSQQKEKQINNQIDDYLKNFSFCIIPDLKDEEIRLEIENQLIATFNQLSTVKPSANWLGLHHPDERIVNSGLWNIQGLNSPLLSEKNLQIIREKISCEKK